MKIFIFGGTGGAGFCASALAEDGKPIAAHCSSNIGWARHDMGLTSDRKHEKYKAHCHDGYELVDLLELNDADLDKHEEFLAAWKKNQALYPQQETDNGMG